MVFSAAPAKLLVLLSGIAVATALLYMMMRRLQVALEKSQTYATEMKRVTSRLEILHEIDRALLSAQSLEDNPAEALKRIQ